MSNGGGSTNATLILVLGILGIVVCAPLGIVAWIMGNNALRELDQGFGDPSTRGMVVAGRILGIIATVLFAIGCVGAIVWFILFFVALAGASAGMQ